VKVAQLVSADLMVAWLASLLAEKMESQLVGQLDIDWAVQMERQMAE
jgi:hypothetical protein